MRYNSIDHNGQILFYINIGYTKYNNFRKHKKKLRAYGPISKWLCITMDRFPVTLCNLFSVES